MQQEGTARFLRHHTNAVKGVAFSPTDRYMFASGGHDGKVNLYTAGSTSAYELLVSYPLNPTQASPRNINGVRFTSDGSRLLAVTTAKKLVVLDVERGEQILNYEHCAFNGRERVPVASGK